VRRIGEPRFSGSLERARIPRGFFEALARRLEEGGTFRVIETWDAHPGGGYRTMGTGERGIRFHVAGGHARSALEDVRVWQEGARTLQYDVRYPAFLRRSLALFLALWVPAAFSAAWLFVLRAAPLRGLVICEAIWAGMCAAMFFYGVHLRRWTARRLLERLLGEVIQLAEAGETAFRVAHAPAAGIGAPEPTEEAPESTEEATSPHRGRSSVH
jgi:hypothetical protein